MNCPENKNGPSQGMSRVSCVRCWSEKPRAVNARSLRRCVVYRDAFVACLNITSEMERSSELSSILSSLDTCRSSALHCQVGQRSSLGR